MRTVTDSCRQGNPRRAGSMSATPGAHGHGGAAMACAPAFICLPCSWRIGQLWCPACLQVTLRCSQTSLGSLTSGVLEMVPFCSLPKCRNPLCLWLFSPGAPGHQGRGKSPAAYTCCLQGPPHTTKRGLWWDRSTPLGKSMSFNNMVFFSQQCDFYPNSGVLYKISVIFSL